MKKPLIVAIIIALICVGCGVRKNAIDTYQASRVEIHDTIFQFREVVRVDSVSVYHGKARDVRNDTIILTDTIRETRWAFVHLNDTSNRMTDRIQADTLVVTETITQEIEKNSKWCTFATIWFAISLLILILIIIYKVWKHLRK